MQLSVYKEAVSKLSIPKLTNFLKAQSEIVEIDDWSKMKAPAKRETLLQAFEMSKELRKEFVPYYGEESGEEADFSEWETADLPDVETPPEVSDMVDAVAAEIEKDAADFEAAAEEAEPEPEPEAKAKKDKPKKKDIVPAPAAGAAPTVFVEGNFAKIVSDVAGLDAASCKTAVAEIEDKLEFEHIRMGVLLEHIMTGQHYLTMGYDSMREYLAAETGLHYRKAMFLLSNASAIRALDIPEKQLKGVSWSSLRYIVQVMDKSNFDYWLDAARSNTHVGLIEMVRAEKNKQAGALPAPGTTGDKEDPVVVKPSLKNFSLYPDQKTTVEAAIEKAKVEGNVDSTGAALDLIASSYTGKPPSDTSVGAVMPDMSDEGMHNILTKLKADEGDAGLVRLLHQIGAVYPDVDINVDFAAESTVAAE